MFITNKRADGYHDLETVFYPVGTPGSATVLNDVLEVVPATGRETALHLSGLGVDGSTENNLVWKAYKLLSSMFPNTITAIDIHLHKAIPMGAGLGGGSSDGAFMLRLLNDYFGLGIATGDLALLSLQLGSDCPFFVYNTPQFAKGRGELMDPVALDLSPYRIEVSCPGIHVSTRDAFSQITPRPAPFDLRTIASLPIATWKEHISNDFEETVFRKHPEIAALRREMYDKGALYASMTGTGSAVYGIFPKTPSTL